MSDSTMVTCRGWWDLHDADLFYPSDLPDDWRLSYFANSYRATLLPASIWRATAAPAVRQWYEDVPAGFCFIAERAFEPSPDSGQRLEPAALTQRLGSKLVGWLEQLDQPASAPTHAAAAGANASRCLRYQRLQAQQESGADCHHYGVVAPTELHRDLRGAKDWLRKMTEVQRQAPGLIIMSRPSSHDLTNWQELLELLGLA